MGKEKKEIWGKEKRIKKPYNRNDEKRQLSRYRDEERDDEETTSTYGYGANTRHIYPLITSSSKTSIRKLPDLKIINTVQKEAYAKYGFEPEPYKNPYKEYVNMDLLVLVPYVKQTYTSPENILHWEKKVASKEAIIIDLQMSDYYIDSKRLKYNIIPRTVLGHAQQGHASFAKTEGPKPNTALEDIIEDGVIQEIKDQEKKSVYASSKDYREETHHLCLEITSMFEKALHSYEPYFYLVHDDGSPLLGIEMLKHLKLSTQAFLQGGFFGGKFDNYREIRQEAEQRFNLYYGGGEEFLLNRNAAKQYGFDLDAFTENNYHDELLNAYLDYEHRLALFFELGILLPNKTIPLAEYPRWEELLSQEGIDMTACTDQDIIQQYVRIKQGKGGSDDLLIGLASLIEFDNPKNQYAPEDIIARRLGAQFADTLDTLVKSTKYYVPGGYDEQFFTFLEQQWIKKARSDDQYRKAHQIDTKRLEKEAYALVDKDEIIRLVALGINPSQAPLHSSTRYFLKVQNLEKMKTTAIEQEMLYLQDFFERCGFMMRSNGEPFIKGTLVSGDADIKIGFHQQPFDYFKMHFNQAMMTAMNMYMIPKEHRDQFLLDTMYKRKNVLLMKG
ncbi:MAG: hypothetical protein QW594_01195 [Candidatus Woesearchaeota archaeon]